MECNCMTADWIIYFYGFEALQWSGKIYFNVCDFEFIELSIPTENVFESEKIFNIVARLWKWLPKFAEYMYIFVRATDDELIPLTREPNTNKKKKSITTRKKLATDSFLFGLILTFFAVKKGIKVEL